IQDTKANLSKAISEDHIIIFTLLAYDELDKSISILAKKLYDWFSLYLPEFEITSPDKFLEILCKSEFQHIQRKVTKHSMGRPAKKIEIQPIQSLSKKLQSLTKEKQTLEKYLESIMKSYCPNTQTVAGTIITARLVREAGSLRSLSSMTSSTIQLLGAERALFRHLKNKKINPPKHGHIINHPLLAQAKREVKGKIARAIADKVSIAAKVDYFKGKFIGAQLKKDLEVKVNG
ncbi:hypothetical protein JW868_00450, partial [Candidatus Woesearchaeota archaeon]|nr:hypothetical protein [Candidatus Woesearchaeota archaeon]